jgi:hypothetical protein
MNKFNMNCYIIFLLIISLIKVAQHKLISVLSILNHGYSLPSAILDQTLKENLQNYNDKNISAEALNLHIELGDILRLKYFDKFSNNPEYNNFSNFDMSSDNIKIYSSNSLEAIQVAVGQVLGLFPKYNLNIYNISNQEQTEESKLLDNSEILRTILEKSQFQSKEIEYLERLNFLKQINLTVKNNQTNYINIETFPKELDIFDNVEKCLSFKDEGGKKTLKNQQNNIIKAQINKTTSNSFLSNDTVLIKNEDLLKIMKLNETFPKLFENYCAKNSKNSNNLKSCNTGNTGNSIDFTIYQDLDFLNELYFLVKYTREKDIKITTNNNKLKNNTSSKISKSYENILLKYHLLYHYNHEEIISHQISTPLFRFVNGYLENSKSKRCNNLVRQSTLVSTNSALPNSSELNSTNSQIKAQTESFLHLKNLKPVDMMRQIINESKCKKFVILISNPQNIVNLIKPLFFYEEELIKLIQDSSDVNLPEIKHLLDLLDPKSFTSFIFQVHQNEDKIFIRIFLNLEEISNMKLKLKINYQTGVGLTLEDLVTHLNNLSDSKIKYKNSCLN